MRLFARLFIAEEAILVDCVYGTSGNTCAACGTLALVDESKVIDERDCSALAGSDTLAASDTAVLTQLTGNGTLVMIRAADDGTRACGNHLNDAIRAGLCTLTATETMLGKNSCRAVVDFDGIFGADCRAVAVAEAGVCTRLIARVGELCTLTARRALVVELALYRVAGALTGHVSDGANGFARFEAKDCGDVLCRGLAAGDTEVAFLGLALAEGLCIAVTAAVAAGAAVGAGETVTDLEEGFVFLNAEKDRCRSQQNCTYGGDAEADRRSNENFHQYRISFQASRASTTPEKP